jgi:pentatricopeptide repeat protein
MKEAQVARMVDVVSFNTLIKAHLKLDNFDKARSLMRDMKGTDLQPSQVVFNEIVNAMVMRGGESHRSQIWDFVSEMQEAGVKPNQVTCSILMKKSNVHADADDIMKTMELINMTEEPMDEVLLSSVVEACVRIGKPELLVSKLAQLQGNGNLAVTSSHTFGSLIKAYGRANDIDGVWRWWKEMRTRHIKPTCITLGCMVEAVVSNGDTEGAYELIHQMQDDEQCREVLNSVIFGSVLKGFAREKKMDRVWAVYDEMNKMKIEFSIVTYNTIINACARCGRMERVSELLEGMKERCIKPNLITYSTMLKGHCQAGNIQTGLQILAEMKQDAHLQPDEIMYNSLLDGCAQKNMPDEGLRLFEEMQAERVVPSNFTLCILVKLMSGAKKLDGAFSIVHDITTKYRFKANVHVYTNLVQACISSRQLPKAFGVLETMIKEGVQPEPRTYAILIRASISQRQYERAAGLLRAALGLRGALPVFLAEKPSLATCSNLDEALVNETLIALADSGCNMASPLLADIKQQKPRVRIDSNTQRRVGSPTQSRQAESHPWTRKGRVASH